MELSGLFANDLDLDLVQCRGTQSEFLIAKILSAEINAQAEEAKVQAAKLNQETFGKYFK